jgi:hypothetical protein
MPNLQSVEFIPTDFALAYATLARRVAAIDAYLLHNDPVNARKEVEKAMQVIEQVEYVRAVVLPSVSTNND